MIRLFRNLYISNRFFFLFGIIVGVFAFGFAFPFLFVIAQAALLFTIAAVLVDIMLLFNRRVAIETVRTTPKVLSLGSENNIKIDLHSRYNLPLKVALIDELPFQLQQRDFTMKLNLAAGTERLITYVIRPLVRGEYRFGKVNLYLRSPLGIVERRYSAGEEVTVPVYPSLIEMKKFELKAFSRISNHQLGIKKIRRLGHSYEFEQIKNYVRGDDFRSINWKATSRKGELMVNQYEDEKSQQIYSVIDKSRAMRMPFNGLSLLDHAINASLVVSNIALLKQDKAGLLSFSEKLESTVKAERNRQHLRVLMDALYKQRESMLEANYEMLYYAIRNFIKGRSLLFLYTNFESYYAMERVLPILRKINNLHLLVVVVFENNEVADYSMGEAQNVEDIYFQTIAQKFVSEKRQIVTELRQYGIQAVLTRPEDLSMNTINKYLELKSRGMI